MLPLISLNSIGVCSSSLFVSISPGSTHTGPYRVHKELFQRYDLQANPNNTIAWYKDMDWQYAIWKPTNSHWIIGEIGWLNKTKGWIYLSDENDDLTLDGRIKYIDKIEGDWNYWIESIQDRKKANDDKIFICCSKCTRPCY